MSGWLIPPPRDPTKSEKDFKRERFDKVNWLVKQGYLRSKRVKEALLKVPREHFIPPGYRDFAYLEVPLPLPGELASISCPHSYPLFYEPLGLDEGHHFLEIGLGSGYGAAVAMEVVGPEGLVVSIEIDPLTFEYAKSKLSSAGYHKIVLIQGDGWLGKPEFGPYDRIAITAACEEVPLPLIKQLREGGRLIGPVFRGKKQILTLFEKGEEGVMEEGLCEVLYVSLQKAYGREL